jgi:hypothetical protein
MGNHTKNHRIRAGALLLLLALVGAALTLPGPAAAQQRERCFPETGHCMSGAILDYWERNGGLAVFGYPISPLIPNEIVEDTWVGPTQWFERDRLEDHSAEGLGVLAGRLGVRLLDLRGQSWWDFPQRHSAMPGCHYFPETRHSLCEPFLSYWQNNGGLERFGYPVSEPMQETIEGWSGTVQYFERRRMEHHTEFAGTPYEVLLGRLGADIMQMAPPELCTREVTVNLRASVAALPFRDRIGCPTEWYQHVPAAVQNFERGTMIWVDLGEDGRYIHVISPELNPAYERQHRHYEDPWQEGDPSRNLQAPEGLYAPVRGFGEIWYRHYRRHPVGLGWAVEPERAEHAMVQQFTSGATVIWIKGEQMIYAFGDDRHEVSTFTRK